MPAFESGFPYLVAVVWPFTGYDEYGQPTVGSPDEVSLRWQFKRREVQDPRGNTIALDAQAIISSVPPTLCFPNGWVDSNVWLGSLCDYQDMTFDQKILIELYQVKTYSKVFDVKGRFSSQKLGLSRLHNPPGTS